MPVVTRSQTKQTREVTNHVCYRCEEEKEELCEDEDGLLICAECEKRIETMKLTAKLVQIKIQTKFGIPSTSPYIEEIEDWLWDVCQHPSVQHFHLSRREWVSALTPLTHLEMLKFALLEDYKICMDRHLRKIGAR